MPSITRLIKFALYLVIVSSNLAALAQSEPIFITDTALAAMPPKLHCPASHDIKAYAIPHSLHSIYSAEVFGIKFSGFDLTGLPLTEMPLSQSFIAENTDKWSLHCIYAHDGLHMTLMTDAYADLITCRFPDGSYQCLGEVELCMLSCRSDRH